jgi:hypothetical protein
MTPGNRVGFIACSLVAVAVGAWIADTRTEAVTPPAVEERAAPPVTAPNPITDATIEEFMRGMIARAHDPTARAAIVAVRKDKSALRKIMAETTDSGRMRVLCDSLTPRGWFCEFDGGGNLTKIFTPALLKNARDLCKGLLEKVAKLRGFSSGTKTYGEMLSELPAEQAHVCYELLKSAQPSQRESGLLTDAEMAKIIQGIIPTTQNPIAKADLEALSGDKIALREIAAGSCPRGWRCTFKGKMLTGLITPGEFRELSVLCKQIGDERPLSVSELHSCREVLAANPAKGK